MEQMKLSIKHSNKQLITKTKDYINVHYAENVSLSDVAKLLFLSPNYFSNIFKEEMGITFREYLRNVRIDKAKEMIKYSPDAMNTIALKVGYGDASHFNRAFKEVTGLSPSQFKNCVS